MPKLRCPAVKNRISFYRSMHSNHVHREIAIDFFLSVSHHYTETYTVEHMYFLLIDFVSFSVCEMGALMINL